MKSKTIYSILAVIYACILLAMLPVGCKNVTPEPGGVYDGREFLLKTDLAIKQSWDRLDQFMAWELANHAQIINTAPEVFSAAEYLRTNAPLWTQVLGIARSNYVYALDRRLDPSVSSNALFTASQLLEGQAGLVKVIPLSLPKK